MEKIAKAKFHVGDLVILKSALYALDERKGNIEGKEVTIDYWITAHLSTPPCMVVVEAVLDNSKNKEFFNEQTGELTRPLDAIRYKCQWFSVTENDFKEQFFYESSLEHPTFKNDVEKIWQLPNSPFQDSITAETVYLKTIIFERKRIEPKKFSKVSYMPPEMLVMSIQKETNLPAIYDKRGTKENKEDTPKPLVIREVSREKVKCMFYNPFTNKFSEQFFIREALVGLTPQIAPST